MQDLRAGTARRKQGRRKPLQFLSISANFSVASPRQKP